MSNTSRKLSSEEVSALMDGLKSGEINSGDGLNNDIEVTSFTFGSDNLELMGDYYALRLINDGSITNNIEPFNSSIRDVDKLIKLSKPALYSS